MAVSIGCGPASVERPRIEDLVIDGLLTATEGELEEPREAFCADENRFVQPLAAGQVVETTLTVGAAPKLTLSACAGRAPGAAGGAGQLRLEVEAVEGEPLRESWPIPPHSAWSRHEIDLSHLAGREVRVRLSADLPEGRPLFVRDFFLEHRPRFERTASREDAPRQILLISVDTLRADAIAALGGSAATPRLDRFTAQAERFTPHYSAAAWTQPSHAALLTGQAHLVHGAVNGKNAIHPGVPTLAERFSRAGWATAGLVFDCSWLDARFGFDRGFDDYRSEHWTLGQSVRRSLDWMDEHRDRSFFYFLHTFEVHSDFRRLPYEAPGVRPRQVAERFDLPSYGCRDGHCASRMLMKINRGELEPLPNEAQVLRYLYDQGVTHLDEQLGALFDGLRERGLFEELLIVLTSDHGESFLEHGKLLHGHSWEEVVRVPLLVKWPAGERAGQVVEGPSGAIDVAPTLIAWAGLEAPELPGSDLRRRRLDRPVFAGSNFSAIVRGDWKAVFDPRDRSRQLYELGADPGERANLAEGQPERLAEMEELLGAWSQQALGVRRELDRQGQSQERELTEEERERLRALGYLQ